LYFFSFYKFCANFFLWQFCSDKEERLIQFWFPNFVPFWHQFCATSWFDHQMCHVWLPVLYIIFIIGFVPLLITNFVPLCITSGLYHFFDYQFCATFWSLVLYYFLLLVVCHFWSLVLYHFFITRFVPLLITSSVPLFWLPVLYHFLVTKFCTTFYQ